MSEKAKYKLRVNTSASRIDQEGEFRSPEQYGVLCCVLAGQLSDDHKLLKAAPELLEALQILLDCVTDIRGIDMEDYCPKPLLLARKVIAKATGEA